MEKPELVKAIIHYQQCLEKYTSRNDEPRMLYCITKLYKMPVTVEHLEETGVGRTVNALRKATGEIGDAAKSLVAKWKEMVAGGQTPKETESSKSHKHESKDKYKERSSSSSHKESDTRNKHENKEKSSTSSYNEEEFAYNQKKEKEESKHRKHERSDKKNKESKSHKHKSSKRKQDSEDSNSEESEYEDRDDNHKQKASKYKSEDSSSSEEEYYHRAKKDKKDSYKHKSSKRKREEDSGSESEYEEVNIKHKKYSEDDEESEEEAEEVEIKKHSSRHHSKQREEHRSESREKSKHESKQKEKKDKKEYSVEDKTKKEIDPYKTKDKHSSKDKSKSSSNKKTKEDKTTDKKSKHSSSKHHSKDKEHNSKKSSSHSSKGKVSMNENGIDSGSGASFAEALGMMTPASNSKLIKKKVAVIHPFPIDKPTKASSSSPDCTKTETINLLAEKKLEPLDINVANLLPEITPNYRPLGNLPIDNGHSKTKMTTDDEALSAILYSKISRTKVYSGNKVIWGKVPSLFDLCTHVLQDNIDALEYTGGVPYSILKPVIERASADQLFSLEHHNPYLIEDTDELWQFHCQKEFRNKRREEMETWRDMYMRCLDEREAKLKALTANIKQSQDKSLPVRQTKLAYVDSVVKPPRAIARKQAKHGTGGSDKKPLVTPSSRLSTLATAGAAGQIAVPNPGARASSTGGSSNAAMKLKKAPLMQKTLAFMKNRCFRR